MVYCSSNCKSLTIKKRVYLFLKSRWIGSKSGLKENVKIGKCTNVMAGSIVIEDVLYGNYVSGNYASNHGKNMGNFLNNTN